MIDSTIFFNFKFDPYFKSAVVVYYDNSLGVPEPRVGGRPIGIDVSTAQIYVQNALWRRKDNSLKVVVAPLPAACVAQPTTSINNNNDDFESDSDYDSESDTDSISNTIMGNVNDTPHHSVDSSVSSSTSLSTNTKKRSASVCFFHDYLIFCFFIFNLLLIYF